MFQKPLFFLTTLILFSSVAHAHFQMLYTPNLLRDGGGEIVLKMPFTHPAANGYVMPSLKPNSLIHVRKGKVMDLSSSLVTSTWGSTENTGISYESTLRLKGIGDNVFLLQMSPYLEDAENIYIQQFVKTVVNVGSFPSDWNTDFKQPAEIVPLTKPYAIYEGGSFTGVVRSLGKPVPFAEIEVEFINYLPKIEDNKFSSEGLLVPPADAFITMTIYADANGTFTFSIPIAGQWGFAALGVGPETEYKGKTLSQDAVIWVQAHPVQLVK